MIKNVAASISAKLKNIAKSQKLNFDQIFLLYLQERLLYRLSNTNYKNQFILKGGLLLYSLSQSHSRPTKDVDLLGKQIANDLESIRSAFVYICSVRFDEDGVVFGADTLSVERIKEDADYEGVRVKVTGHLGNMKKQLQLDIGFGDAVVPKAIDMKYPTLLEMSNPEIKVYSIESVISEKFEAMIALSVANSRLKDFYDIYYLTRLKNFDGRVLYEALFETFQRRGTNLIADHVLFTDEFARDPKRSRQWIAFQKKLGQEPIPFEEVMSTIKVFLEPIYKCLIREEEFFGSWNDSNFCWDNGVNNRRD